MGSEKKNQIDFFDNSLWASTPTNPDYDQLARDMGAVGFKVEDYKDVRGVVEEAIKLNKPWSSMP